MARRHILGAGHRSWSFTKGARLPGLEKIAWDRTIADAWLDTADHYGADVRLWAERILANSDDLIRGLDPCVQRDLPWSIQSGAGDQAGPPGVAR
jgi:hypothetical protein